MAKINPILADIRGKLAGLVFARNASGAYVRQKVTPVNPQTNRQNAVRGFLGSLASAFSQNLSSTEQEAWKVYADNTPLTDVFGNAKILSAINMYARTNVIRLDAAQTRLDAAPLIYGEAPLGINEPTADPANEFIVESTASAANPATLNTTDVEAATTGAFDEDGPTGQILQVQVSPKLSDAINFYTGPWAQIAFLVSTGALNELIIPLPGTVAAGDVYFARYRYVDATGRVSPFRIMRYTAVTLP